MSGHERTEDTVTRDPEDRMTVNSPQEATGAEVSDKPSREEAATALTAALQGEIPAIVCYAQCWACMCDQHYDPPKPHPWAGAEDIEHAQAMGKPAPTGNCACHCAQPPTNY